MGAVKLQKTALYHLRAHVLLVDAGGLPGTAADFRHKLHKTVQPFPVMGMPLQKNAVADVLILQTSKCFTGISKSIKCPAHPKTEGLKLVLLSKVQ